MTTGSSCRRSNRAKRSSCSSSALAICEGALVIFPQLFVRRRFARVGDDLTELRHGQDAWHPELADDEGRRAPETERHGLIAVAREDRVDRVGVGGEIAVEPVDVDASPSEQFADTRL